MEARDFDILFHRHFDVVIRVLSFYSSERAEIEDWAHDVFVKIWESRERIDIHHPHVRAYILTTARRHALQALQAKKIRIDRSDTSMPVPGWNNVEQHMYHTQLQEAYQQAVRAIPEKPRKAFLLSRERGLSYAEIADTLGVTTKTVEAHISTAMKILREKLRPYL